MAIKSISNPQYNIRHHNMRETKFGQGISKIIVNNLQKFYLCFSHRLFSERSGNQALDFFLLRGTFGSSLHSNGYRLDYESPLSQKWPDLPLHSACRFLVLISVAPLVVES